MTDDLVIQRPAVREAAELLLLLHGVGSSADDLVPLGRALAAGRPQAWVVSVRAPNPSDFGAGWQWFSVQGVTDASRPGRVAAAMPAFRQRTSAWQERAGVAPLGTALIGFSQGAIMALESTQQLELPAASRVIAVAGRFARPPHSAPTATDIHLMHGQADRVMLIGLAFDADRALRALGARSTLDIYPGLGHSIDARVVDGIRHRLDDPTMEAPR